MLQLASQCQALLLSF